MSNVSTPWSQPAIVSTPWGSENLQPTGGLFLLQDGVDFLLLENETDILQLQ